MTSSPPGGGRRGVGGEGIGGDGVPQCTQATRKVGREQRLVCRSLLRAAETGRILTATTAWTSDFGARRRRRQNFSGGAPARATRTRPVAAARAEQRGMSGRHRNGLYTTSAATTVRWQRGRSGAGGYDGGATENGKIYGARDDAVTLPTTMMTAARRTQ